MEHTLWSRKKIDLKKKPPAKMATLTNRACKFRVALFGPANRTEGRGGGFLQSLHAFITEI